MIGYISNRQMDGALISLNRQFFLAKRVHLEFTMETQTIIHLDNNLTTTKQQGLYLRLQIFCIMQTLNYILSTQHLFTPRLLETNKMQFII